MNLLTKALTKVGISLPSPKSRLMAELQKASQNPALKDNKRISYRLQRRRDYLYNFGQDALKAAIMLAEDPYNPRRFEL